MTGRLGNWEYGFLEKVTDMYDDIWKRETMIRVTVIEEREL
jgi:hypothetical protein